MRYYLDEIKQDGYKMDIPVDDERREVWSDERQKFGFDGRDTWSLDTTMTEMMYERLNMYYEKADKVIVLETYTYEFEDKTYNRRELILMMIEDAKFYLSFEYGVIDELQNDNFENMNDSEVDAYMSKYGEYERKAYEAKKRLWNVWALVQNEMSW